MQRPGSHTRFTGQWPPLHRTSTWKRCTYTPNCFAATLSGAACPGCPGHRPQTKRERKVKTLSRGLITCFASAALVFSTAGIAQAYDPNAPADAVAETIAAVAPEAGEVLNAVKIDGAFETSVGETSVAVRIGANGPVTITSTDKAAPNLTVALPDLAGTEDARKADDGTLVYTSKDDASLAIQPLADGSTRFLSVLENKNAPERYEYTFEGFQLEPQDDGSVLVLKGTTVAAMIATPWATDAAGSTVATHYQVTGDTLIQVISHLDTNVVYPITADPRVSLGFASIYLHFDRAQTKTIAGSTAGATGIGTFCTAWALKVAKTPATAAAGIVLSAACVVGGLRMVNAAKQAENSRPKKCLYIRHIGIPVGTTSLQYMHFGTYRDARCK